MTISSADFPSGAPDMNDEAAFLRSLEQRSPETPSPAPATPALPPADDEESFLNALQHGDGNSAQPAHTSPATTASPNDEAAFLDALQHGDDASDAPPATATTTEAAIASPVSHQLLLPLPDKLATPGNAAFLEQLKAWRERHPGQTERLLAYLAVFGRLERTVSNDALYLILRELGRALCDCLNQTASSSSDTLDILRDWSVLIRSLSPLPCQLKVPCPGASVESSWMQASSATVNRILTWAVANANGLIYPAEVE